MADELRKNLPVHCRVDEAWVMVGDGMHWERRHRVKLAA